jgi:hypothetical protein
VCRAGGGVVGRDVERGNPSRVEDFVIGSLHRLQHRINLCAELWILSAVLPEECFALVQVEVSEREEDGFC